MKKPLALGVVFLLIGMTALTMFGSQDRSVNERVKDRFVGAWRLASLEGQGADGKVRRSDTTGLLVFTRYEASFGSYEIDESGHTFTFHVEGALVRTLIGKDLPRSFEFSGKQLIVKSTRPDELWRVTWEHY